MIDYSGDYQWWDNTEAVTVATTLGGTTTTTSVAKALSLDINRSLFRGMAGIEGDDLVWMIPVALMGSVEINQADKITQGSGKIWLVKQVFKRGIGTSDTHFECLCAKKRT